MQEVTSADVPTVKVAVIGDSGVGKSSIVRRLCQPGTSLPVTYQPTIGCEVHVLPAQHPAYGLYFVELWDMGGNPRFASARCSFYEDCEAYVFVWDSSLEASYHSVEQWISEISAATVARTTDEVGLGNSLLWDLSNKHPYIGCWGL